MRRLTRSAAVAVASTALLAACTSGTTTTPSSASLTEFDGSSTSASPASSEPAEALDTAGETLPPALTGGVTTQTKPATVTNTTGIDGVVAYDTAGYPGPGSPSAGTLTHDHVPGPVTYAVNPPVGGPHYRIWINAGIYTKPVPTEMAVHDLEHGAVWITYKPSLAPGDVSALQALAQRQSEIQDASGGSSRYVLLSPWADDSLSAPIVANAWGYQLTVDSPSDPRLQAFLDTFRASEKYSPEPGSPVNGVPPQLGGTPAAS